MIWPVLQSKNTAFPDGRVHSESGATKERKNGKSGQVGLWSREYRWKERAEEWDAQAALYYGQRRATEYREMCTRHVKQIRVAQAVIGQLRHELSHALRKRYMEFRDMNYIQIMTLMLRWAAILPTMHRAERAARGVKLIIPKSKDGIRSVPEWHVHEYRVRGEFQERPGVLAHGLLVLLIKLRVFILDDLAHAHLRELLGHQFLIEQTALQSHLVLHEGGDDLVQVLLANPCGFLALGFNESFDLNLELPDLPVKADIALIGVVAAFAVLKLRRRSALLMFWLKLEARR
jgi:hypothetical protein